MTNVVIRMVGAMPIDDAIKYNKVKIQRSDTITLIDHQPESNINSTIPYFQNTIIDIFARHNIDYQNKKLAFEHYMMHEDFDNVVIDLERNWFINSCKAHLKLLPTWNQAPQDDIHYNLSYGAGIKHRTHRILAGIIIANIIDHKRIRHTAPEPSSANFDKMIMFFKDCDYNFDHTLSLPGMYYPYDNFKMLDNTKNREQEANALAFCHVRYEHIYKHTALSIIPETCFRERAYGPTEKTLDAIYSGCFMIWVGAWKSAEVLEKIGFDVFHDVIDHSYQYIEHPGKRVAEALLRNKELILDIDRQRRLKTQHHQRLQNNLNLSRNINQLISNITKLQGEHDDRSNQRT